MDVLDKFFKKYSYKFPKGYPDMNDEQDKKLLFELIENITDTKIISESQSDYDQIIRKALGLQEDENIPICQTSLSLNKNFNLGGKDEEIWSKLYSVLPYKKNSITPTAGAGKGEIATYWAFEYNTNKHTVIDSRKLENPDLTIDGYGCEVKSYDTPNITLGKFAKDAENIALLNKVFAILIVFSKFDESISIKINPGNFKANDLIPAFNLMAELEQNTSLRKMEILQPLYSRIDSLYTTLKLTPETTPKEGAAKLLKRILFNKLSKKPRMGKDIGYILNVSEKGLGRFYLIDDNIIDAIDNENILNGVYVASSELGINFNKLFTSSE